MSPRTAIPRCVALIASSYHPNFGGVEEHTRRLAIELTRRGHHVEVWTVLAQGAPATATTIDGIVVRRLPTPLPTSSPAGVFRFLWRAPGAARAWRSAVRRLRPDVLHVQCFGPNGLYASALSRTTGIPLVVSLHGETFMDDHDAFGGSWLLRTGLTRALARARAVTGCSQLVLDDAVTRFSMSPHAGRVVFNGVDPDERPIEHATPAAVPFARYVFALGRVVDNKGFDLLLDAFARVSREHPDLGLVIAGDGPRLPALTEQVRALGLTGRVVLAGRAARADVGRLMAAAEIFVMPSRIEPFGMVVLEAWREARPVIVTSRGGTPEFVRDGTDALLVDPCDVAALATTIGRLARDPLLRTRLGSGGASRMSEFTSERVCRDYLDVYEVALGARPGEVLPMRGATSAAPATERKVVAP